jgi:hypothetical protein
MARLTGEVIQAAIEGFEAQKRHIDAQIAELRASLAPATVSADHATGTTKRKMSSDTIKRMREGQQRRWAKARRESASSEPAPKASERNTSAAGRNAIVEAQKKQLARSVVVSTSATKFVTKKAAKKAARKAAMRSLAEGTSGTGPREQE